MLFRSVSQSRYCPSSSLFIATPLFNFLEPPVRLMPQQPSSLVAYLGITANGKTKSTSQLMRSYNAIPIIAYYDIFKNYYANKQEENFYLMNYENQIVSVTAMTAPSGGSQLWNRTNPNRINKELPDEQNKLSTGNAKLQRSTNHRILRHFQKLLCKQTGREFLPDELRKPNSKCNSNDGTKRRFSIMEQN